MTFCDTTAGTGSSFGTHGTDGRQKTDGWTDRRESRNSHLDEENAMKTDSKEADFTKITC